MIVLVPRAVAQLNPSCPLIIILNPDNPGNPAVRCATIPADNQQVYTWQHLGLSAR